MLRSRRYPTALSYLGHSGFLNAKPQENFGLTGELSFTVKVAETDINLVCM